MHSRGGAFSGRTLCLERGNYADPVETSFCCPSLIISHLDFSQLLSSSASQPSSLGLFLAWSLPPSVGLHPVNIAHCISQLDGKAPYQEPALASCPSAAEKSCTCSQKDRPLHPLFPDFTLFKGGVPPGGLPGLVPLHSARARRPRRGSVLPRSRDCE